MYTSGSIYRLKVHVQSQGSKSRFKDQAQLQVQSVGSMSRLKVKVQCLGSKFWFNMPDPSGILLVMLAPHPTGTLIQIYRDVEPV